MFQKQRRWTCIEQDGGGSRPDVMHFLEDVWVDVMRLDGTHGTPLELGAWTIQAMIESQSGRIHSIQRAEDIKAAKYRKMRDLMLRDHKETDYAGRHYKDLFEANLRHRGVRLPVTIREERVAASKKFEERRNRRLKRAEVYGRDVSV